MRRPSASVVLPAVVALAGAGLLLPRELLDGARMTRERASPPHAAIFEPTPPQLVASFDVERALDHIRHLAEKIGPRPCGSAQERAAADYIAEQLGLWDWDVQWEESIRVPETALRTRNVVATHPLAGGGRVLIAGAHYDSSALQEASPGANDNASGVAVLLEAARIMRHSRLPYELRLVFFGGEERTRENPQVNHVGSDHHVARMSEAERERVIAMISVDMVGAGPELIASRVGHGTDRARQWLLSAAERLGLDPRTETGTAWSDHEAFERAAIPTVWLTRMGGDDHWHTAQDTACRIGPLALTQAGRLTIRFLLTVAEGR